MHYLYYSIITQKCVGYWFYIFNHILLFKKKIKNTLGDVYCIIYINVLHYYIYHICCYLLNFST